MPLAWIAALLLTLAIETPIVVAMLRPRGVGVGRGILLACLASLATHPVVWFVFPALPLSPWPRLWLSELWAVLAEALIYGAAVRGLTAGRALALSFAANAASASFGLALSATPWGAWLR